VQSHALPWCPSGYTCRGWLAVQVDDTMWCLPLRLLWAGGVTRPRRWTFAAPCSGRVPHVMSLLLTSQSLEWSCHASAQSYAGQACERMLHAAPAQLHSRVALSNVCHTYLQAPAHLMYAQVMTCSASPHSIPPYVPAEMFYFDLAHSRGVHHTLGWLLHQISMYVFRQGRSTPIVLYEILHASCSPFVGLTANNLLTARHQARRHVLPLSSS